MLLSYSDVVKCEVMILWLFLALLPQSPVAVVTSGARELTLRLKQQTVNPAVLPLFHLLLLFIVFPFLFASFKQNKKIKKRTAEKSISKRSERSCQINYWCYKTVLRSRRSCGWLRELISFGNRTAKQNQKTRKKKPEERNQNRWSHRRVSHRTSGVGDWFVAFLPIKHFPGLFLFPIFFPFLSFWF